MLGDEFSKAIELMNKTNEHIIICGMGKSGLVGRKISSTLASTGTPSIFLHPAEAIHGDLGKAQKNSVVLLISYSGETGEIIALIPALKRLDVNIIALTGVKNSTLANISDIVLDTSVDREACPLNLAPTTSTLITMVLGDALAVSLMELKNFKQEDFALTHPGGSLGRRLLSSVKDEMKQNNLQNKIFGIECNFEELNGIDFKKGCYVGQENTARIKLKNKLSKRLFPINVINGKLHEGESIYRNEIEIGKVLIDSDYPFALIKYLNENFDEKANFKTKEASININKPDWIKN